MSALPECNYLTPEEYLLQERAAEFRSEYWNGLVEAMAGASLEHNLLKHNIEFLLGSQLRNRPCFVFSSDMKVRVKSANLFRYPDISAVCGPVDFFDEERDVYHNPALIVEVLSPSTERYDRQRKFALYGLVESLGEYLLVSQDGTELELHRRGPDGRWTSATYTDPEAVVTLESVGCELRLSEVYAKMELIRARA